MSPQRSSLSLKIVRKGFDEDSQPWSKKPMKVVSLVPSWTELLIECGVNVVGRTRFCLHPAVKVHTLPAVGGTKDLNLEKLEALKADLLILDQEENLLWMKEKSPIPTLVTHVTSIDSVAGEIKKMADQLPEAKEQLLSIALRWKAISHLKRTWDWHQIPGEIETIQRTQDSYENLVYVIWKKPWMAVAKDTFIGSVLGHLGAENLIPPFQRKYPEFQMQDFDLKKTYFLFSSEPFPFHKKKTELLQLGIEGSLVNGESFSWFGVRSLRFLEQS